MIVNLINEGANIALVLIVRVNEKGSNIEYNYTITISNTTAAPMVMVNKDFPFTILFHLSLQRCSQYFLTPGTP